MAQIMYTDGTRKDVKPKFGDCFEAHELNEIVGGYIEIVETVDGGLLVLDEEGKLKQKPLNREATCLYKFGGSDPIVGDVLYLTRNERHLID